MWQYQQVPIKIQLGEKTLFAPRLRLQVREVRLDDELPAVEEPLPPADTLRADSQGFLIRSLRVSGHQPVLRRSGNYLCYVASQYSRYYIDMQQTFAEYKGKFSSKTRSTLNRKIRKYEEYSGGNIFWKVYRSVNEMAEFYRLARIVSATTYQERLLDAGLPDSGEFFQQMKQLAEEDKVRGFILFHQDQPVSYLYCPISNGVVLYAFLGYNPVFMNFSVGTVLQWLALESLFEEKVFRFFDFTEGQSEHKKLFATHSLQCINIFFLRTSLNNLFLICTREAADRFARMTGGILDRLGMKAAVRRLMRFGG